VLEKNNLYIKLWGVNYMENHIWRFGVVANITEYHIGDDSKQYRGTKPSIGKCTPFIKNFTPIYGCKSALHEIAVI